LLLKDGIVQAPVHATVLLAEAVEALVHSASGSYIDGTFGRGGHSQAILRRLGPSGSLTVFDKDPVAIEAAQALQGQDARVEVVHAGFASMAQMATASVDGILLDLGVSSPQIDTPERGFSFRFNGPLDMRMDNSRGMTVAQWLLTASVSQLTEVIRDYGEERFAGPIAKAIAAYRDQRGPVDTTEKLAQIVGATVKSREPGQNPATRTFQAFRIFINRELEELQTALEASIQLLKPQGRLVVISFHSLEDRIAKTFIARHAKEGFDRRMPMAAAAPCRLRALGRVRPSAFEVSANPRARSAVMRVAERTVAP
jgi:16S rRNA (cytosine1402-N4)-methyltransferase